MATIITKNSSTASSVPLNTQLVQGELAVNVTDKRLFTENASGTVVELGTNPSSLTLPNGVANGVCYLNGSKVLTTGSALTFDGTTFESSIASGTAFRATATTNTNNIRQQFVNAGGTFSLGLDSSSGSIFGAAYAGVMWHNGNYPLVFGVNNAEQMRLTSTGLGIGTSSPAQKLDISGAGAQIALRSTDTTAARFRGYVNGAESGVIGFLNGGGQYFETAGTERMRLDASGNLGLGVTPTQAFSTSRAIQIGGGLIEGRTNESITFSLASNAYLSAAGNWTYTSNNRASLFELSNGTYAWKMAGAGTGTISFTQAMTLDASSNLTVGGAVQLIDTNTSLSVNSSTKEFKLTNAWGAGFFTFSTNGSERARIDSSGNFNIGANVFSARLNVYSTTNNLTQYVENANNSSGNTTTQFILGSNAQNTSSYFLQCITAGVGGKFYIYGNGTYGTISDRSLKKNIETARDGYIDDLMRLRVVKYNWNTDADGTPKELGWIAQELAEVFPGMVQDSQPDESGKTVKEVKTSVLPFMLLKAIQEQQAIINQLKADMAALKAAA